MKNLRDYLINEEYKEYNIHDLIVKFRVNDYENLNIQCPSSSQENDVTQYLDDVLLNEFPSAPDKSERFFGDNVKFLNDAYFEYDKFTHNEDDDQRIDIKYDEHKSGKQLSEDDTLDVFTLTNVKYVLNFDEFNIQGEGTTNDILRKIFKTCESNNENKYTVKLKLIDYEIKYRS